MAKIEYFYSCLVLGSGLVLQYYLTLKRKEMNGLLLLMAQIMPEDELVEEIKNLSTEYTITKNEETKKKLQMYCTLFATKGATEGKDILKINKEMEEVERIKERMNVNAG